MPDQGGPSSANRDKRTSSLVLILVLLVSAFIQLTVVSRTAVITPLRADAGQYFSYAYNLTHFGVYSHAITWDATKPKQPVVPDSIVTPGYPLFLAAVGNPEPTLDYVLRVTYVQAVLGILSVWLIFLISVRFLGRGWAHAVALLAAISPHLATISTYVLTESLFVFLLFAAIYSLLVAVESRRRWQFVVTGLAWGLCCLVRPTMEFFPPLLLLAAWMAPKLRAFAVPATLAFACFAAVLAPWLIRSHSLPANPAQPSLAVKFLQHGAYPQFMYEGRPESYGYPYAFDPDYERHGRDASSVIRHIADSFLREPGKYSYWYVIDKPIFLLSWSDMSGIGDVYIYPIASTPYLEDGRFVAIRNLVFVLHWPLMVLGLLGAVLVWLKPQWLAQEPSTRAAARLIAALVGYAIVFHMIGAPYPRYGIPFRPLLYALAVLAIHGGWRYLRASSSAAPAPPTLKLAD